MRRTDDPAQDPNRGGGPGGPGGPGPRPVDIGTVFNQILAAIMHPSAIHGDVAYSQEHLDRIVSELMELNPQSNAAPPAAEDAIASLPKKKLDEEMLGPELKGECTICIDEVKVGDEVVVLPCRHWFHEECASLWLKQHNSCPVCRAPIDGTAAGKPRNDATSPQDASQTAGPSSSSGHSASDAQERLLRSARLRQAREEFMRDYNATPSHRRQTPRESVSPPTTESSAQRPSRVRTPSPSDRRSNHGDRSRDSRGSSGLTGPFHWIRDRFSGR